MINSSHYSVVDFSDVSRVCVCSVHQWKAWLIEGEGERERERERCVCVIL